MKVGEYVRTKSNGIQKIDEEGRINLGLIRPLFHIIKEEELLKSSPNIIDLIEVGDLARIETEKDDTNIFEVVAINYNDGELGIFNNNFEFDWASIEQLKSIVTKEQFEAMEYKCE